MELIGTIKAKGALTGSFDFDQADYNLLKNKPSINGVELVGNKTSEDLHIETGGGGTTDYNDLTNKPMINGIGLIDNKTANDLGLQEEIDFPQDPTKYLDGEGNFTTPPTIGSYNDLTDKPQINGVTLTGNKTGDDLDLSNKSHFTELSGSVVSFQDGQELPLAKCIVDISPTQDLHGYTKPWAGGTGKNKADGRNEWNINASGEIISSNNYATCVAYVTQDNTYTFSVDGVAAQIDVLAFYTSTPQIESISYNNSRQTFISGTFTAPITGYAVIRMDRTIGNMQVEEGSTASAYEPYANICPITGESSVTVTVSDGGGNDTNYTCALGRNVYGGSVNVVNGDINITKANIASYAGETLPGYWISDRDEYEPGTPPTTGAQVVYDLDTIQTDTTTPIRVKSRTGNNEISADTGDIDLTYINNVNDPAIEFILNNL